MSVIERNDRHEYFIDGIERPGVNFILETVGVKKPCPFIKTHFLTRGKYTHQAIDLEIEGVLDYDNLDDALCPFIDGFRDFVTDTGIKLFVEPIKSRWISYSNPPFCGEYDGRGQLPDHPRPAIGEWKTGYKQAWHKYQVGLYALAKGDHDCFIVWLSKEGKYKWEYFGGAKYLALENECRDILANFYREFMNGDLLSGQPVVAAPFPMTSSLSDEPGSTGPGFITDEK